MRICVVCNRPIRAGGVPFIPHSASGARPDAWAHDIRDPSCQPSKTGKRG
ncbi:hypothetical protein [Streptomyces sp. NPDC048551]